MRFVSYSKNERDIVESGISEIQKVLMGRPRWSRCLEYQLIDEGDDTYRLGEAKVKWVS